MSFDVLPFIETKRDGGEHAPGEMKAFVEAFQTGKVKDYQVSAWLMAAFLRGLSSEERRCLTECLADSGRRMELPPSMASVDKHSTGGVGDKTTLVLVPLVASCGEPVQGFLRLVFRGDLWERFRTYPAAVANHHAYAHGLLEHTLAVTEAAPALGDHYRGLMPLDRDLVVAGGLLHDLGKVEAYAMNPVPEVTLPGAVVDHVALGYARFMDLVREHSFPEDRALALAHILLSHHGQREYGSPVVPATPEALVVSAADELDFRLFCWMDSFRDAPEDQVISPYHAAAQRRFWRGPVLSEPSEG